MSKQNSLKNYSFIKTIGEGTFGKVKLALHKITNEEVAIKILEKAKIKNNKDLERIDKEIKYMKMLNHPNIVKIYEIFEDKDNYYISMEYVSGGELFNYIVKNKRLNENETSFFYSQIIHIIQEIHKHKICHRDLKPENLLLTQNKTIKLIDFGLSNEYEDYLYTPCGSPCYASPEVIKGLKYSGLAIDLWASGIILYSMLCGYLPFDDKNNDNLFRKILKCRIEFPTKKNLIISENAKDLIKKILKPDPKKRITLEEILEHPFLSYGNKKYKERINMDINKQDKLIIDYMINELKISNENDIIRKNITDNEHNNNTTIFNLLKKKYNEGRFYNILQKKGTDNLNRYKILKRFNNNKLNKTLNTETDYNNNNLLVQDIKNLLKRRVKENNIIIINNNNNLVNQPHKMNYVLNSILKDNIDAKYKKILKKIELDNISLEKPKKENKTINISQSPRIESYKENSLKYNSKINGKNILYKKYINTSLNKKNNQNNDSTLRADSFNTHNIMEQNSDKLVNLNLKGYNEYKKKIIPSSHLKTLTNLQYYNTLNNNKEKETQYNTRISLKNKYLINSLIYGKNDLKKNFNSSIVKKETFNPNLYRRSPDNKIYTKYFNYLNNFSEDKNKDVKINEINRHTHNSLINEIKNDLINENNSMRNDDYKTLDNSNNKLTNKKIANINIGKEKFYKKLNFNKLKEEGKKIKVNKLTSFQDKPLSNNVDNNTNLSERERYPKSRYTTKTVNNETVNNNNNNTITTTNNMDTKRLKFKLKELTEKKILNNSLAYSKKICIQNKSFSKTNNNIYEITTNLSTYQITNRISKFCLDNNLLFNQTNQKYNIIIEQINSFVIEMNNTKEGRNILKFTHENGDENITKKYLINLYSEIAK